MKLIILVFSALCIGGKIFYIIFVSLFAHTLRNTSSRMFIVQIYCTCVTFHDKQFCAFVWLIELNDKIYSDS